MLIKIPTRLALFLTLASAAVAAGQGLETVGSRGAAMAAFVAVADDASAVVWNPSGLVTGPIFNLLLDASRRNQKPEQPPARGGDATRVGTTIFAIGALPVGLTYYRMSSASAVSADPAVVGSPDRQDRQVVVRTIVTSHVGATVQQSVGQHLTLGATLKFVRGEIGQERRVVSSWEEALDAGQRLDRQGSTRGDVDVGAMAYAGRFRLGVVVRNVTEPTFGREEDLPGHTLSRHARVGVAWGNRWTGISSTIAAFDADMTRVSSGDGERRDIAGGVEHWFGQRQIGMRGGMRASTIGELRPVFSGGVSYAVRPGTYVDAYFAAGEVGARAWGIAARLTY